MADDDIYQIGKPTSFASPPKEWSFTSLTQVQTCPRQWQLRNAHYGSQKGFPRRANARAIEGEIIHDTVDRLFKALALAGRPAVGTPGFVAVMSAFDPHRRVVAEMRQRELLASEQVRVSALRWSRSAQRVVNEIVSLLRGEYTPTGAVVPTIEAVHVAPLDVSAHAKLTPTQLVKKLRADHALTELPLHHPTIALKGTADLVAVRDIGIVVVDFKTGKPSESHRYQVQLYALMWWRSTGEPVAAAELLYPSVKVTVPTSEKDLLAVEERVRADIANLTKALVQASCLARTGPHCRFCDPRAFCNEYWAAGLPADPENFVDLEFTMGADRGLASAGIDLPRRKKATLLFRPDLPLAMRLPEDGQRVRALSLRRSGDAEFELTGYSELFEIAGSS